MMRVWAAAFLGLLSSLALGQVGRVFTAVEGYVAAGQEIYVGRIASLERTQYKGELADVETYGKPYRLVFDATETIRGPQKRKVEIILSLQIAVYLQYMRDHRFEIMLVAGPKLIDTFPMAEVGIEEDGRRVKGNWYQFRVLSPLPERKPGQWSELGQMAIYYDSTRMFTMDLGIVKGRDQILGRARAFAKKYPAPLDTVELGVPNAFAALVGSPNAFSLITLPVCPETDKTLLGLLRHPESMFQRMKVKDPSITQNEILLGALKALKPFPSKEGRELAQRIADGRSVIESPSQTCPAHWVKEEATKLLEAWKS